MEKLLIKSFYYFMEIFRKIKIPSDPQNVQDVDQWTMLQVGDAAVDTQSLTKVID